MMATAYNDRLEQSSVPIGIEENESENDSFRPRSSTPLIQNTESSGLEIEEDASFKRRRMSINNRELLIAAGRGDTDKVKYLIKQKVDVHFEDADGNTALHYAVRNGQLEVVKLLLGAVEDICIYNKAGKTPLDIARESKNQSIVKALVQKVEENATQLEDIFSKLDICVWPTGQTQFANKGVQERSIDEEIKKVNDQMKSLLESIEELNKCDGGNELTYEQANVFINFVEAFALEGSGNEDIKDEIQKYFSLSNTDKKRISEARKLLLKNPNREIELKDVHKFIEGEAESFFKNLESYLGHLRQNSQKAAISRAGQRAVPSEIFITPADIMSPEENAAGAEIPQNVKQQPTKDANKHMERVEENRSERGEIKLDSFLKKLKGKDQNLGEPIEDHQSFLMRHLRKLLNTSTSSKSMTHEVLFNFLVNFYPAFEKAVSKGNSDFEELRNLRNKFIHEFHTYGHLDEYGKELSILMHKLFRYCYARYVHDEILLCEREPGREVHEVDKNFKSGLELVKTELEQIAKQDLVISEESVRYYSEYKYSQSSILPKSDHPEIVKQYLWFTILIDYRENDKLTTLQSGNLDRRKLFDEFCHLKDFKNFPQDFYNRKMQKFREKITSDIADNFDAIYKSYEDDSKSVSHSVFNNEIGSIVTIIKGLKQLKDDYQLTNQLIASLYMAFRKTGSIHDIVKDFDPEATAITEIRLANLISGAAEIEKNIRNHKYAKKLRVDELIINMLDTFYNAYNRYRIEFEIEEIFSDELFLNYLVAEETERENIELSVVPYLKLTLMIDRAEKENNENSTEYEKLHGHVNREIFEEVARIIRDLRDKLGAYKLANNPISRIYTVTIEKKGEIDAEQVQGIQHYYNIVKKKSREIADKFKVLYKDRRIIESLIQIEVDGKSISLRIPKIVCDILEAFEERVKLKNPVRAYMEIKKFIKLEYTVPYIVRLITKGKNDEVIEHDDLVMIISILLTGIERNSHYIVHLDELLRFKSYKLNLYEEVCNQIIENNVDIEKIRAIFENHVHAEEILDVLDRKIDCSKLLDEKFSKTIRTAKTVVELLFRILFDKPAKKYKMQKTWIIIYNILNKVCDHELTKPGIEYYKLKLAALMSGVIQVSTYPVFSRPAVAFIIDDQWGTFHTLMNEISESKFEPFYIVGLYYRAVTSHELHEYTAYHKLFKAIVEYSRGSNDVVNESCNEVIYAIENLETYKYLQLIFSELGICLDLSVIIFAMGRSLIRFSNEVDDVNAGDIKKGTDWLKLAKARVIRELQDGHEESNIKAQQMLNLKSELSRIYEKQIFDVMVSGKFRMSNITHQNKMLYMKEAVQASEDDLMELMKPFNIFKQKCADTSTDPSTGFSMSIPTISSIISRRKVLPKMRSKLEWIAHQYCE